MGYSRSTSTVRKILPQLQMLAEGKPCRWETLPGKAHRWATQVREALFIAARNAGEFPTLANAAQLYTIREVDDHTVVAERTGNTPEAVVRTEAWEQNKPPITPRQGMQPVTQTTLPSPRMASDIIAHWLRVQPTNDILSFPDAQLDDEEMTKLSNFMSTRTPAWMVLKSPTEALITVAPDNTQIPRESKWPPVRSAVVGESANPEDHRERIPPDAPHRNHPQR